MADTEDIQVTRPPAAQNARRVLVAAFPKTFAFDIPKGNFGRDVLQKKGLVDLTMSQDHAEFTSSGSTQTIKAHKSRHGTFVNGQKLAEGENVVLPDGAVIRMGQTLFVYRAQFVGDREQSDPLGKLIAPYGLRNAAAWLSRLKRSTPVPPNVLVLGPTGAGKEAFAREIHDQLRPDLPFVPVNIAAILPSTFEAQVFGYAPHSWTGASAKGAPGLVRSARGGTVFFDEVGDLPMEHQTKLLRLLEDRKVMPVGGQEEDVDVLLICATSRDLQESTEKGSFRRDFCERFRVTITLPSLADRMEDLPSIVAAVARKNRMSLSPDEAGASPPNYVLAPDRVDVAAVERLMLHSFEGNVRELERIVWRAVALGIEAEGTPTLRLWALERDPDLAGKVPAPARVLTREQIEQALEKSGGNQSAAAESLGVSRASFLRARDKFLK